MGPGQDDSVVGREMRGGMAKHSQRGKRAIAHKTLEVPVRSLPNSEIYDVFQSHLYDSCSTV